MGAAIDLGVVLAWLVLGRALFAEDDWGRAGAGPCSLKLKEKVFPMRMKNGH